MCCPIDNDRTLTYTFIDTSRYSTVGTCTWYVLALIRSLLFVRSPRSPIRSCSSVLSSYCPMCNPLCCPLTSVQIHTPTASCYSHRAMGEGMCYCIDGCASPAAIHFNSCPSTPAPPHDLNSLAGAHNRCLMFTDQVSGPHRQPALRGFLCSCAVVCKLTKAPAADSIPFR